MKIFELGFGTGDLLFRFDTTCTLHGCEASQDAINSISRDPRNEGYKETLFVACEDNGAPSFPSTDYDLVIASHVLEHMPNDIEALNLLNQHTRVEGLGLFFLPLERPCEQSHHHARTYTAAGFVRLLEQTGWEAVEVSENLRYDHHWERAVDLANRSRIPGAGVITEALKNILISLAPAGLVHLAERPFEFLHVMPRQLMALARKAS